MMQGSLCMVSRGDRFIMILQQEMLHHVHLHIDRHVCVRTWCRYICTSGLTASLLDPTRQVASYGSSC